MFTLFWCFGWGVWGLGFRTGLGFRFSVFGFRISKSEIPEPSTAFDVCVQAVLGVYYLCVSVTAPETRNPEPGSGFRVPGSGFRVPGSGFRVPGSGFKVPSSVFRGSGLGHRVIVGVVVRLQPPRPHLVLLELPCFREV